MALLKSRINNTTYSWKSDDIRDGEIKAITEIYGSKNLWPFNLYKIKVYNKSGTWNGNTYTVDGLSITVNPDGTALVNGTKTSQHSLIFYYSKQESLGISDGTYIVSGNHGNYVLEQMGIDVYDHNVNKTAINVLSTDTGILYGDHIYSCNLQFASGVHFDNLLIDPMIRDIRIKDSTYSTYAMTNKELTNVVKVGNNNRLVGFYTKVCTNPPYYVICLPYSERLYGPLTADMIDFLEISSVGWYQQNISVDTTNDNILAVHSDDLPQDIQYVNAFCRVYLK